MNEIIHGYVVSVILTKFRINANIQLWQSFSILNFEIGIVSDFLQYINPCQTVILSCLTGLNLNWFKSYGLRCSLRPKANSANSQKIATDKRPFYDHICPFFANHIFIFHKTEIQTVILRCLISLNLNWYKSYDTKRKYFHFFFFCDLVQKQTFPSFVFFVF